MTLQGDLSTLELADIVQNLDMHKKSGTLTVETAGGTSKIYFDRGAMTLLAASARPSLVDDLVTAGLISAKQLAGARKARWRTRTPLTAVLVKRRAIDAATLRWFAEGRLQEDLCAFLSLDVGAFTFTDEKVPRGTFDPEERCFEFALPVSPLLFEAARRKDHGAAIHASIPSEAAHYHVPESYEPDPDTDEAEADLAARLAVLLDGTKSVREVLRSFPHRRFAAREMLARLVGAGIARTLGPDEMVELVRQLADGKRDVAWRVVRDALDAPGSNGRHVGLLREKVQLALALGEKPAAAEALKMLAHVEEEVGDREGALKLLLQAGEHDPHDTGIWEKALALAAALEQVPEAIAHGLRLVALYRKPGLHSRACAVLETLTGLAPDRADIQIELARSRADCGNPTAAVAGLERFGKRLLAREDYPAARAVQEEILKLVPGRAQALETIAQIDDQAFARRRERRERFVRRTVWGLAGVLFLAALGFEGLARHAYSRAERAISDENLIEERRYDEAAERYATVAREYPATWTALIDVRRRTADLRAKSARR
jgi:tetratricopeptide (TPR) repeat protein